MHLRFGVSLSVVALMVTFGISRAHAQTARQVMELQAQIGAVVGRVSEVWELGPRYEGFHKELTTRFPDTTPDLEAFTKAERWITVVSSNSIVYSGVYRGRSPASLGLEFGDIVAMKVALPRPTSYEELGLVTKVLCRQSDPGYKDCARLHPLAWFDRSGQPIQQLP